LESHKTSEQAAINQPNTLLLRCHCWIWLWEG